MTQTASNKINLIDYRYYPLTTNGNRKPIHIRRLFLEKLVFRVTSIPKDILSDMFHKMKCLSQIKYYFETNAKMAKPITSHESVKLCLNKEQDRVDIVVILTYIP